MHKNLKINVYIGLVIAATFVLIFRFITFASKNDKIKKQSFSNERGIIYDRNMEPVALSIPAYTIYLDKKVLASGDETSISNDLQNIANHIIPLININPIDVNNLLSSKSHTIRLQTKISDENYRKLLEVKNEYNIKSVYGILDYKRVYPDNDMFSHTLGYLDKTGTSGYSYIEAEYQHLLADYNNGTKDLVLTLDKNIQAIVRNELLKVVADSSVQSATVIIQDVNTGAVLSSYSYPSFDPNNPFEYSANQRNNRAIMSATYPGSTMKIFTLTAALEANSVSLDEYFACDGTYEYSEYTHINCDHSRKYTRIHTTDILKYSCNTAIITIAERLDNQFFYNYLRRFGFGEKTGINITDKEWPAIYHPVNKWHAFSKGYLSLGYDLNVTPMQLINAYSILVNGGIDKTPYIVDKIIQPDNSKIMMHTNQGNKQIIEKKYSDIAKHLLAKGVEIGGTGALANIETIGSIGKTGTASLQILPDSNNEDNDELVKKYYNHSIFVGAIPAKNPSVSILVLLNGPKINARSGGKLAAPLFKTIAMQVIPYLDIIDSSVYDVSKSDFASILPETESTEYGIMPNLHEKSLRDVFNTLSPFLNNMNLNISLEGQGYVTEQYPKENIKLTNNQTVSIKLSYPTY